MSEGEAAHLGWVMAHPARARRRVRAARVFISPEAEVKFDLLVISGGAGNKMYFCTTLLGTAE